MGLRFFAGLGAVLITIGLRLINRTLGRSGLVPFVGVGVIVWSEILSRMARRACDRPLMSPG